MVFDGKIQSDELPKPEVVLGTDPYIIMLISRKLLKIERFI